MKIVKYQNQISILKNQQTDKDQESFHIMIIMIIMIMNMIIYYYDDNEEEEEEEDYFIFIFIIYYLLFIYLYLLFTIHLFVFIIYYYYFCMSTSLFSFIHFLSFFLSLVKKLEQLIKNKEEVLFGLPPLKSLTRRVQKMKTQIAVSFFVWVGVGVEWCSVV